MDFNTEILQIADSVARDKGIPLNSVYEAIKKVYQVAGKTKYGNEHNIRVDIDRKSGEVKLFKEMTIVEEVTNPFTEILLKDALEIDPEAQIGGATLDILPPIDLVRTTAQKARSVLISEIFNAEREQQFKDYEKRVGDIVVGKVKRVEYGNVTVDLGRVECILARTEVIRGESYAPGDTVRAYIKEVRREKKGPQIFLTRVSNEFLIKLFEQEVPEIYDNIIIIKAVARDPGSRAKIAVYSQDSAIEPVSPCVGVRGSRVQAISNELNGEKIDILKWNQDPVTFVVSALTPAEVAKVVIDEEKGRVEVVVPDDQLSLAIGRRGQNVRLASKITGWKIDILTENEESKRRVEEFNTSSGLFITALNIEEVMAQLLVSEGFTTIEEIAYVQLGELSSIEGFDEALATELQNRARNYLEKQEEELLQELTNLGVTQELLDFTNLDLKLHLQLAKNGVFTIQDLADLSTDEFKEFIDSDKLTDEEINTLIMDARQSNNQEEA